jgi:hypothetical protein
LSDEECAVIDCHGKTEIEYSGKMICYPCWNKITRLLAKDEKQIGDQKTLQDY